MSVPVLIGHRGSCGYRPEHTLASYELAARTGADYLEPDVVATRDGVLVCRHENELSDTTDVAHRPEFADLRRTKVIDGVEVTGWFTEDLTLEQVKTLRAVERLPQLRVRNTALDGQYHVPTFAELLELRAELEAELRRPIGVYVETKHPTHFAGIGLALEEPLLADLAAAGLSSAGPGEPPFPRVVVQSFELGNLQRLRLELGCRWPLVYLIGAVSPLDPAAQRIAPDLGRLLAPEGLRGLADYVDGIGPNYAMVFATGATGATGSLASAWSEGSTAGGSPGAGGSALVRDAHAAGLLVHPWTFRAENQFLPEALRSSGRESDLGDLGSLIRAHLRAGIDGFFTDHVDLGRAAIDTWVSRDGTP